MAVHRLSMKDALLVSSVLLCSIAICRPVEAFVVLPVFCASTPALNGVVGNHDVNRGGRHVSLVSMQASNSTAADQLTTSGSTTDDQENAKTIGSILSQADPLIDAPLPPAYTDCPFTGILGGPTSFYRTASQALQSPNLFSFVHKDQPMVEVSGGANVQQLLNQEFTALSSNAVVGVSQIVCGTKSLRTAQDKTEHKALRDLVGVPLSGKAVTASIPRLEMICRHRIQDMMMKLPPPISSCNDDVDSGRGRVIKAVDVTQAMALDVTWQQVLGLNLQTQEEIDTFHAKTYTWLRGIYSKSESPELKATLEVREYLVEAIETKIAQLKEAGESDGSTVGGLLFATIDDVDHDDDNNDGNGDKSHNQRTLSYEEVIDNALLLILAATETTSSNLANALLLMGLHSDVWRRVVDEQNAIVNEYGETITQDVLEHHCTFLDAVVRETLRILPVTIVSRRETSKTIVIDGKQIPKGWGVSYNMFLTHQRDESMASDTSESMDLMTGFRPSRWLDTETRPSNRDYIPFGAGPRKCPGIALAKTEMKTFLAIFARSVEYELVMDIDKTKPIDEQIAWKQLNAVPMPEDGVQIRVLS